MNLLQSKSIKVRLLFSFLLCVILMITIGIMGNLGMKSLDSNAKQIYSYDLKSIEYLHQITAVTRSIASHIENTSNDSESILTSIKEAKMTMDEVASAAQNQTQIAEELTRVISLFKI